MFKNEAWVDAYPNTEALINWDVISDHCYCIIKTMLVNISGVKPFRYYNMWAEHLEFRDTVLSNWSKPMHASGLVQILRKLDRLKYVMHKFNKVKVGDVTQLFSTAKENYQQAQFNLQQDLLPLSFNMLKKLLV